MDHTKLKFIDEDNHKDTIEAITRLINLNGGYFILGSLEPKPIGTVCVQYSFMKPYVIAEATKQDAENDCKMLGLDFVNYYPYYYKMALD
jgi:hypothetical protein